MPCLHLSIVPKGLNSMLLFLQMLCCGLGDKASSEYTNPQIHISKERTAAAAASLAISAEELESYIDQARRENIPEDEQKKKVLLLIADLKEKEALLQKELSELKSHFQIKNQPSEHSNE